MQTIYPRSLLIIEFDWHEYAYGQVYTNGRMVYRNDMKKLTAVLACSDPDQVQYPGQDHWEADHILACFA